MARKTKTELEAQSLVHDDTKVTETISAQDATRQVDSHAHSRCGGALRLAREQQTLTTQDIANKLRLSIKQIEAIEADNFTLLPEPTIVRGFIRNYAKLLKLNAEPLLDAYHVMMPDSAPHGLTVKPSSTMKMSSYQKPQTSRYAWFGLAALFAVGTWFFYQNYIQKPSPASGSLEVLEPTLEPLPEPALPAAERQMELQSSTVLDLPSNAPSHAPSNAPRPVEIAANAVTANNAAPVASSPVASSPVVASPDLKSTTTPTSLPNQVSNTTTANTILPAPTAVDVTAPTAQAGMISLAFNASQETWISISNLNGKEIYSKTIFAGSRDSLEVKPPVNVTVGNAGATTLTKNGKPIALAPHMRGNVARLKLD